MSLDMIETGAKVRIISIDAGHGLITRLVSMGLIPGAELTVINNSRNGPFVVAVKDSRIMLGRGMAQKILVK